MKHTATLVILLFAFAIMSCPCLPTSESKLAPTPTQEPVGPTLEEKTRIAKHIALYDEGGGNLNGLCSTLAGLTHGEQTLPPQQGDADFYEPSEINQYWTAELNDPNGDVWTVACVVSLSRVTSEGTISLSEPVLVFLYNTADGYIYPQGDAEITAVGMLNFNVEDALGQPKIYAPLDDKDLF